MAANSGRKIAYGLALESSRGVAVAPTLWVRWETADFYDHGTTIMNQSALGVLDKYSGAEIVQLMGQGQISGKITDRGFGLILFATYGSYAVATHSGETVVFDHTFTESQLNSAATLTITRKDPNVVNQFAECMVSSLEVAVKAGDFVRHTTQFVSQPSSSASATVTYVDENEFIAKNVTVKFAASPNSFGGSTAIPVESIKLTMAKDANPYWIIGQNNPSDIFAQTTQVKGEMVLLYSDDTYKNLRFNNTMQSVQVSVVNSAITIGTSSHPTITFTMPAAFLNDWKIDQSIDGMVKQTVDFEATFAIDYGYATKCVLTNTVSTYNAAIIS